jgi:hypothetical protein
MKIRIRKGAIGVKEIIAMVLAILGFVIVLFLLASLELDEFSEDEVCKLSVLSRGTLPDATKNNVPLKCQTGKICITTGGILGFGGECEQFIGEDVVKVKIPKDNAEEAARIIEETNANAQLTCWSMMGEGKIELFSSSEASIIQSISGLKDLSPKVSSCFVCARIALDKDFVYKKKNDKFTEEFTDYFKRVAWEVDINKYMEEKKPEGSVKTYNELMLPSSDLRVYKLRAGDLDKGKNLFDDEKSGDPVKALEETAMIFMQISTKEDPFTAGLTTGITTLIGAETAVAGTLGIVALAKLPVQGAIALGSIGTGGIAAFQTHEGRLRSAAHCGTLAGERDKEVAKKGCSILAPVDFEDVTGINKLCNRIEGEI